MDNLAIMPIMDIQSAVQRRNQTVEFVAKILLQDTDYGIIPGTDKPTLLKPGAEKLTTFFGLSKKFQIIEKVEDWTGKDHNGEPFFYYLYRCQLWRGDLLVSEADGSCNSMESKYRWRWVDELDVPPHLDKAMLKKRVSRLSEFEFAINKAETTGKYGKPAEYWQRFKNAIEDGTAHEITKQTASGKGFLAWEIESTAYRIPNDDIASQVNTIQKMSQKRALIASTLLAVNASEFFTQDLEDYVDTEFTVVEPVDKPEQPAKAQQPQAEKPRPKNGNGHKPRPAEKNPVDLFFEQVNAATNGFYKDKESLYDVLGKWPKFADQDAVDAALSIAVDHANQ